MSTALGAIAVAGGLLLVVGLILALATSGGLDERMPTQVPPRRLALTIVGAGVALLAVAAAGAAFP
jgi:hypothetical protein